MSKLSDVLGKKKLLSLSDEEDSEAEASPDSEAEESDDGVSPEEVSAMKLFTRASTTEEKARALKMFLKACGAY